MVSLGVNRIGMVQSNKVYLLREVLLVSTDFSSRQINAIR